ncbi:ATP-dependent protease ATPase subunit HslU [bacterium]|nr:ATP-dependent protease ATPase subunit HslU [bacterium]
MSYLTPQKIVEELDKYIVGQYKAKKAVAIALRNRYRRKFLPPNLREEIIPKNILMIGPTGVGKTEIARRMARIVSAPFIKVEATKFTEVGYVGRDVDSIIRDLMNVAVQMVRQEKLQEVREKARVLAIERILDVLYPLPQRPSSIPNPFQIIFGGRREEPQMSEEEFNYRVATAQRLREEARAKIESGEMDNEIIEIEVEDSRGIPAVEVFSPAGVEEYGLDFQELFGNIFPKQKKRRKVTIKEAKEILTAEEADKLIDMDEVKREAKDRTENLGVVFIDEIDKIVGKSGGVGPDVSREGVQRDLLPIIEGSTVQTKYGPVKTDHILFIAAGAFHSSSPSDLIPELQGRLPIRVELDPLTEEDFRRILTEPENALCKQYQALLATEGVDLRFTPDGVAEIAKIARLVNERTEDIGARRLHTVMERLLEDVSFQAPSLKGQVITVDAEFVRKQLGDIVESEDLSRFIL